MRIGFISLGCPKNRVDTEIMMSVLKRAGHRIVSDLDRADMVIVNTCGFITPAKEESINTILETAQGKKQGMLRFLVATGCLAQRYGAELLQEMGELDGVMGISKIEDIGKTVERVASGERVNIVSPPTHDFVDKGERTLTTPPGMAYLKIAEGCDNRCSYCAIPLIRGGLRSKSVEDVVREARELVGQGIKEIVLIAQDVGAYGMDIYGRQELPGLLKQLDRVDGLQWLRLMYLHPHRIGDDLIEVLASGNKILPYLDIPVQHAADRILRDMKRRHDRQYLESTLGKLRERVPGLVLRSTVMVGYPGETEDEFEELYDFVGQTSFDWLGAFAYNPEENTAAGAVESQVEEDTKQERLDRIMKLQNRITRRKNKERLNSREQVLISTQLSKNLYTGRGYYQAPEVDGVTIVKSDRKLVRGEFATVLLKGIREYDVIGETVDEHTK